MSWVQQNNENSSFVFLRLTPNAHHDDIHGVYESVDGKKYLQVSVQAVPENGKANKAAIAYLAKIIAISKSDLKLKSGSKSRFKCFVVNLSANVIKQKIEFLCIQ